MLSMSDVCCIAVLLALCLLCIFFFFKQKTAYEMRISDWSSDVCSSDLPAARREQAVQETALAAQQHAFEEPAVGRHGALGHQPREDRMTLQEVEDPARHVGGEALHHAVRHEHPFAVRARQADESPCRRQSRRYATHLGLPAVHIAEPDGART